ncbi:stability determinant [Sphingomonas sp. RT2P30]|uniref:type II toxin-antitoxin system RelB family antitoxin n=1 Tax=Parasphingomonas halimpatiens TaxID=3096162 RepID=UPI002FC7ABDD
MMTDRNLTTTDEGKAHDAWVRSKVERALASKLPAVPHDQVMAEVPDIINAKRRTATFPANRRMERFNALNKKG